MYQNEGERKEEFLIGRYSHSESGGSPVIDKNITTFNMIPYHLETELPPPRGLYLERL
jgi:hypothetical protein